MKHLAIIQSEFIRFAKCWANMSEEEKELTSQCDSERQEKADEDRQRFFGEDVNGNSNFSGSSKNSV